MSVDVAPLSVDVNLAGFSRCIFASSLHDDVVNDGVSDTRLCVSSKPSSFNSCEISLLDNGPVRNVSLTFHSRSGVGDFKLLMASRTSSWLIRLMLLPIFPMRDTTSLLTLFFDSLLWAVSGDFASDFFVGDGSFSALASSGDASRFKIGKLASLMESGDVVAAFVTLSSVALLRSIGRLKRLVRRADEKRSNCPSPRISCSSFVCSFLSVPSSALCNGRGTLMFLCDAIDEVRSLLLLLLG